MFKQEKNSCQSSYSSIKQGVQLGCIVFISTILIACGKKEQTTKEMPAPAVTVYEVNAEQVGNYREFVARTVASKEVNLTARVEGELIERNFEEGSLVEKGQKLLAIEPTNYQVSLASAKADLASKMATAKTAERDLIRGRKVAKEGYISPAELDKLIANDSQAQAAIKVAQANLEKAQLNLGYTVIAAPFAGRIGKVNFNIGTVVGPTSSTLATLTATDPIYVSFQVEESDYISYLQKHQKIDNPADVPIDISLRLPNNTQYGDKGLLNFADTKIEQGMGTVELRASFNNPDEIILPGLYVTIVIESKEKQATVLVPQSAVQESQQGKFVLVVDEQNKVVQRLVTLGRRINALWAVQSGLERGERVIVEGLQKVKSGIEVKPVQKRVDAVTGVISDFVN